MLEHFSLRGIFKSTSDFDKDLKRLVMRTCVGPWCQWQARKLHSRLELGIQASLSTAFTKTKGIIAGMVRNKS